MKKNKILLLLAVPFLMLACNNQQNRKAIKNPDKTAVLAENAKVETNTGSDQDFIKDAALGGMMEVELGQYAEQNATNPRVKNFGAMMVRDHSKANVELKSIASGKNISVPATMDDEHMNKVNDLKKKTGPDFDREYMKEMVDDHNKDVDNFRKEAESGNDADIKAFASKTLPVLITHQDSAKSIRDALK